MTRIAAAMDQLADREARCDLAHFLAAWFSSSDPESFDQAMAAWEAGKPRD